MSQWYAGQTMGGREAKVLATLAERGHSVFLPMLTRWSTPVRGAPREPSNWPLIPGYLFVLCEPEQFAAFHDVEGWRGFVEYETADGLVRPIPFPLSVIVGLQVQERAGTWDYTRQKKAEYRPRKGEKVKITGGTWLGFVGRVLDTPRGQRVQLMIEGPFGRGKTIELKHVQPA